MTAHDLTGKPAEGRPDTPSNPQCRCHRAAPHERPRISQARCPTPIPRTKGGQFCHNPEGIRRRLQCLLCPLTLCAGMSGTFSRIGRGQKSCFPLSCQPLTPSTLGGWQNSGEQRDSGSAKQPERAQRGRWRTMRPRNGSDATGRSPGSESGAGAATGPLATFTASSQPPVPDRCPREGRGRSGCTDQVGYHKKARRRAAGRWCD